MCSRVIITAERRTDLLEKKTRIAAPMIDFLAIDYLTGYPSSRKVNKEYVLNICFT
jgi:hypothetical protein